MVTYFNAGTQWAVETGNPSGISQATPAARRSPCRRARSRSTTSRPRAPRAPRPARLLSTSSSTSCRATRPPRVIERQGRRHARRLARHGLRGPADQRQARAARRDLRRRAVRHRRARRPTRTSPRPSRARTQKLIDTGVYKAILDKWGVGSRRDHDQRDQPGEVTVPVTSAPGTARADQGRPGPPPRPMGRRRRHRRPRGDARPHRLDEPALGLVEFSGSTPSRTRIRQGVVTTIWLTVASMAHRRRARHRPRGHAALAQPGAAGAAWVYVGCSAALPCSSSCSSGRTSARCTRPSRWVSRSARRS